MGTTSGIGREIARLLAAKGWQVGIAGRREELLQELQQETDGIVCYRRIDITDNDAPKELERLIHELGGMNLYLHSSGIGWQNNSLDPEKELKTMETNGMGFVRMLTAAFNRLAANGGGQIACITSIAGTRGLGAAPAYSSTKRFQSHYLECLSQLAKMRRLPIRITDIRPGFVKTDLISGSNYPLQMDAADVAADIVEAVCRKKETVTIDWRYRLLVFFWKLIPRRIWTRMKIG